MMQQTDKSGVADDFQRSIFQRIISNSPTGYIVTDPAGYFMFVNRTMENILQMSNEELKGKSIFNYIEDETKAVFQRQFGKAKDSIAPLSLETAFIRKKKFRCRVTAEINSFPEDFSEINDSYLTNLIYINVTKHTENIASEKPIHDYKDTNRFFVRLLDYLDTFADAKDAFPDQLAEIIREALPVPGSFAVSIELPDYKIKSGKFSETDNYFRVKLPVKKFPNGELIVCYTGNSTNHNETFPIELKGFIKDIAKITARFFDNKIKDNELLKAQKLATESERIISSFLNIISHEVKTPLNAILGFSRVLTQPNLTEEEKKLYLPMLNEAGKRLSNTINDYLDVARLQSGNFRVSLTRVNILDLLDNAYDIFLPQIEGKGLNFNKRYPKIQSTIYFETDTELFMKCIQHLLDNACKFTFNGSVTLGCRIYRNKLSIYIKDTGIGIAETTRTKIFKLFAQGELFEHRTFEGNGLGLTIAFGITKLLGGEIEFSSAKNSGSLFSIVFPVKHNDTVLKEPNSESERVLKSGAIMIISEDQTNRFLMENILTKESYIVFSAKNDQEASVILRTQPEIRIIMVDIEGNLQDRLESLKQLRLRGRQFSLIAITGDAPGNIPVGETTAEFSSVITKPFDHQNLLKKIMEAVP